jgi:competence protein ComEA
MTLARGQVAIWAVAAVLAVLAVVRLVGGGGQGAGVPVTGGGAEVADESNSGEASSTGPGAGADGGVEVVDRPGAAREGVYVHVAGRVRRPGLYRLRNGDRVAAALARAGGPARGADLASVNLAARVEDGQQVLVPPRGATARAGSATAGGPGEAGAAKLSLASATVEQLDELDGIGPTLAERIVEYRERHGGFRSVSELNEVEGIGEKRMEALSEAVGP